MEKVKITRVEKADNSLWNKEYLKFKDAFTNAVYEEVNAKQEIENNQDDKEMQKNLIKEYERLHEKTLSLEKQLDEHVISKKL